MEITRADPEKNILEVKLLRLSVYWSDPSLSENISQALNFSIKMSTLLPFHLLFKHIAPSTYRVEYRHFSRCPHLDLACAEPAKASPPSAVATGARAADVALPHTRGVILGQPFTLCTWPLLFAITCGTLET